MLLSRGDHMNKFDISDRPKLLIYLTDFNYPRLDLHVSSHLSQKAFDCG